MVTAGNNAVERQVTAAGGTIVDPGYGLNSAVIKLSTCDGLLITGGGDVNPLLYSDNKHPQTQSPTTLRDVRELALIAAARDLGMPVFGICRGLQIIVVEAGGTLYQHVPDKVKHSEHDCAMMPVTTVRGSAVHRALGDTPNVLHLHHQSLRQTPAGFQVTARHVDGTVEAIESIDGRVVAVQFHPESVLGGTSSEDKDYRLFVGFLRAARRFRRRARAEGIIVTQTADKYLVRWPIAMNAHKNAGVYYGGNRGHVYGAWGDDYDDEPIRRGPNTFQVGGTKVLDKRVTGGAKLSQDGESISLIPLTEEEARALAEETLPVAFCSSCGVPFDVILDYTDHMNYFHKHEVEM